MSSNLNKNKYLKVSNKPKIILFPVRQVNSITKETYVYFHLGLSRKKGGFKSFYNFSADHRCGFYDPRNGEFGLHRELLGRWLNKGAEISEGASKLLSEFIVNRNDNLEKIISTDKGIDILLKGKKMNFFGHIKNYNTLNRSLLTKNDITYILQVYGWNDIQLRHYLFSCYKLYNNTKIS